MLGCLLAGLLSFRVPWVCSFCVIVVMWNFGICFWGFVACLGGLP